MKFPTNKRAALAAGSVASLLLAACGSSSSSSPEGPAPQFFTIGGQVSGLLFGHPVVLQDNGGDSLSLSANGTFAFDQALAPNSAYAVTVQTQPIGQQCDVVKGSGKLASADVTNIVVSCKIVSGQVILVPGSGGLDGTGSNATFTRPAAVAADTDGNVYVADAGDNEIRKVMPNGEVSRLAYTAVGTAGIAVAPDNDVYFTTPFFGQSEVDRITSDGKLEFVAMVLVPYRNFLSGITVNAAGEIYVADTLGAQIDRIYADGNVSAFAGSGVPGFADGTGLSAQFSSPRGIAADTSGNLYVADYNEIRKITPDGVVSTLAGSGAAGSNDGIGSAASFNAPTGVSVDGDGNVYVSDSGNNKIRQITPSGVVTTVAGSGTAGAADGRGTAASFNSPRGAAVDGHGNLYVADSNNDEMRRISPSDDVTTLAGSTLSFYGEVGAAVDSEGNVYVADTGNNQIRKVTAEGVVTTLAGSLTAGAADGTGAEATFNSPNGVALDASGNLYVADTGNHEIREISPAGVVTTLAGSTTAGSADGFGSAASFESPAAITVNGAGHIFVADYGNSDVREIFPGGQVITVANLSSFNDFGPRGIAVDPTGTLYVSEDDGNVILKIVAGEASVLAGSGAPGFTDGTGSQATFFEPAGLALDSAGNLYVADSNNLAIRKIAPNGAVSTVIGSPAPSSPFRYPVGLAIDTVGNLYVADPSLNQVSLIAR